MTSSPPPNQRADPVIGVPPRITAVARVRRWRWLGLGLAGLLVALLAVLFFFNPSRHNFYPFCVFYRVSGLQCPGCGGLRAAHHLLHGEVVTAFRYNQLVVLAAPAVAFCLMRRWWRGPRAEKISHRAQARWAWLAFAALVVFWIVRNLPFEIFKLPAG